MLINTNYKNKSKSEYFCDVCGKRFGGTQILKMYKYENDRFIRLYDLCNSCNKLLNKTMKKICIEKGGQIIK